MEVVKEVLRMVVEAEVAEGGDQWYAAATHNRSCQKKTMGES